MNLLIVSGNLVADSVRRTTPAGKHVLGFKIANNEGRGEHEVTTFYDCSLWGDRALKLEQHFTKGLKLVVTGSHSTEEREHNGKTYTNNRIFVHNFEFAGGRSEGAQGGPQQSSGGNYGAASQGAPQTAGGPAGFDDNLPFDSFMRGSL